MTIQLKLTLWYTALLGVTLIMFSGSIYYALFSGMNSQLQDDAKLQAAEVERYLLQQLDAPRLYSTVVDEAGPWPFSGALQLVTIPKPAVVAGSGDVQIFSLETGEIIRFTNNNIVQGVPTTPDIVASVRQGSGYFSQLEQNDVPFLVYSFPIATSRGLLGVQILQSLQPSKRMLNQVWRNLLIGTLLTLIFAALVGAYLARRALRPLTTITNTAGSISQTGDLGRRLTISESTSEVGQLATTFNQMLDQIQRLFQAQERLVADVGHELRTPLTTIQGNVELLQRAMNSSSRPSSQLSPRLNESLDAELDNAQFDNAQVNIVTETAQETLKEVESEVQRMSMIISDLLLVAQAESGNIILRKEQVEMDTLLLDVYRQTRKIADRDKADKSLVIRLGSEDQAVVHGDKQRLRQLLLNLVENAVKYSTDMGHITLSLKNSDGWVQVSVSDTGIGISEENQQHIFERFYRTDKARSRELGGSGLGLSIVQWIAQAHDGHVRVESTPQVGSTFTLWLPEFVDGGEV